MLKEESVRDHTAVQLTPTASTPRGRLVRNDFSPSCLPTSSVLLEAALPISIDIEALASRENGKPASLGYHPVRLVPES